MARMIMKEGYSLPSGLRFGFHDIQVLKEQQYINGRFIPIILYPENK